MVRSQLACSFRGPGIAGSRCGPMSWPRFHGFSMIAKIFAPLEGAGPFGIMKGLLKSHARRSHPPPHAHFPAFRAPSQVIALSWAFTHAIAGVKAHDNRVVKAVTRGAGGRGGNLQVVLRRALRG